jgi:hypothetical protein
VPPPIRLPSSQACCLLRFSSTTDWSPALRPTPSSQRLCSEPVSPRCPPLTPVVIVTPHQIYRRRSSSDPVQRGRAVGSRRVVACTSPVRERRRHPNQCHGLPGNNGLRLSGHGPPAMHCANWPRALYAAGLLGIGPVAISIF